MTKEDRFAGPFEVTTSAPVLVVGNTFDPATPLHGARAVNRLLGGSRLLVLDGWGHGAIGSGPCINQAYAAYLVDVTLPPAGTVCKPEASQMFPQVIRVDGPGSVSRPGRHRGPARPSRRASGRAAWPGRR